VTTRKLGIIADDLTGAMDSSGYFASIGYSTVVVLEPDFFSDATVLVVNTNSRAEASEVARKRVRQVTQNMAERVVYKKIDSTLRGNIGEELKAASEVAACQKVVVAPAFPQVERTTVDGILLVKGTPVAHTQFASDPISPVKESSIPDLLEHSMHVKVGRVSLTEIEAGPEALKETISNKPEDVIVCDVLEQFHLGIIAKTAVLVGRRWLLCGSGGLARELHLTLTDAAKIEKKQVEEKIVGPALVVVGTRNRAAADQLLKSHETLGIPILNLEVERLNIRDILSGRLGGILREADKLISEGKGLAISLISSRYVPALKQAMAGIMAEIIAGIMASHRFAGLFLSGGDIAMASCRRLKVSAIKVHGEIEPGVPAGEIIGGQYGGMRVVTKAGGFGTEEAMVKSIEYLERGELP